MQQFSRMFGRKMICVRCINRSYNKIAKGIRLHDKITIFAFIQVRAFESNFFLNTNAVRLSSLKFGHYNYYFERLVYTLSVKRNKISKLVN